MATFIPGRPDISEVFRKQFPDMLQSVADTTKFISLLKQQKAENKRIEAEKSELDKAFNAANINPNLPFNEKMRLLKRSEKFADQIQMAELKQSMKPQSMLEMLGSYLKGEDSQRGELSRQPQQFGGIQADDGLIHLNIGGNDVELDPENVTPEMRQSLEAQGIDLPLPNTGSSVGQLLSSAGVGLGSRLGGIFGDIADVASSGLSYLEPSQDPDQRAQMQQVWQKRMEQSEPGTPEYEDAKLYAESLSKPDVSITDIQQYTPSTQNIKKIISKAAKGTFLEPYVTPQTQTQKQAERIGDMIGLVTNPSASLAKGGALNLVKDLAKGTGVALGADVAGWMTQRSTGSELLGDIVRNGSLLTYNLFPGMMNKAAADKYKKFDKKVIEPALKTNKMVDPKLMEKSFSDIDKDIGRLIPGSEAHSKLYPYAARLDEMMRQPQGIDPQGLLNNTKEMTRNLKNIPEEGKRIYEKMLSMQENALTKFGNKISPNSGNIFKDAIGIEKADSLASQVFDKVPNMLRPRNAGIGSAIWLAGGFPILVKAGLGYAGSKYVSEMLKSPGMRTLIGQAFKASSSNNARLLNDLARKIDKKAQKVDPATYQLLMATMNKQK